MLLHVHVGKKRKLFLVPQTLFDAARVVLKNLDGRGLQLSKICGVKIAKHSEEKGGFFFCFSS